MYECFHCGNRMVVWDADFNSEEYGYEEGGIIHELHCDCYGAYITYFVPQDQPKEIGGIE